MRWAFEALPDYVRAGLPLLLNLSTASDQYFATAEADSVEDDTREEMLSVRRQVGQGLAVSARPTAPTARMGNIHALAQAIAKHVQTSAAVKN